MTTLELLTKAVAILTAVSLAKTGLLTPSWATAFGVVAFFGSFARDQWIRSREQLRMQPSWSFWFIIMSFGAPKPATHRRPKPATMWVVLNRRIVLFGPVGKGHDQVVAV